MANKKIIGFDQVDNIGELADKLFVAGSAESGKLLRFTYSQLIELITTVIESKSNVGIITTVVSSGQVSGDAVTINLLPDSEVNPNRSFLVFVNTLKAPVTGYNVDIPNNRLVFDNLTMPYKVDAGDFVEIYYTKQ